MHDISGQHSTKHRAKALQPTTASHEGCKSNDNNTLGHQQRTIQNKIIIIIIIIKQRLIALDRDQSQKRLRTTIGCDWNPTKGKPSGWRSELHFPISGWQLPGRSGLSITSTLGRCALCSSMAATLYHECCEDERYLIHHIPLLVLAFYLKPVRCFTCRVLSHIFDGA